MHHSRQEEKLVIHRYWLWVTIGHYWSLLVTIGHSRITNCDEYRIYFSIFELFMTDAHSKYSNNWLLEALLTRRRLLLASRQESHVVL